MLLPKSRGRLSETLFTALRQSPSPTEAVGLPAEDADDAAIALWACYELAYRGFDDVDDRAEWDPHLLTVRAALEDDLERRLRSRVSTPSYDGDFAEAFFEVVAAHDGPSLARRVRTSATLEQVLDLLRWRSVYHLKEADPTAFAVPRLEAGPKAALVEVLYDEYGTGRPERLHHELFARGLEACGLRPEYGAYVDEAPTEVLEQNNAMSLFGLHRRLRGAAAGHLAAFEATSSVPSRQIAQGLERLGLTGAMVDYYAEHVEADAVHEQLAVRALCGVMVEQEPRLEADVWLGAITCLDLEARVGTAVLERWDR